MSRSIAYGLLALPLAFACSSGEPLPVEVAPEQPPEPGGLTDDFVGEEEPPQFPDDLVEAGGGAPVCGGSAAGSCSAQTFEGETVPLDIFIVFDQSFTMESCTDPGSGQLITPGCQVTRLDAVRQATEQFMGDPESAGIGIGLGLFGKQPIGEAVCGDAAYIQPEVPMGLLPEHAANVSDVLASVVPTGETPTGPALRGACTYATGYRSTAPDHQVVLLLLTDGRPEAPTTCSGGTGPCCPTLDEAVAAADECRATTGIRTYVLGVGPLLDNLEQIAVAGGTERAYLVGGGDVGQEVLNALNRIRGSAAIPCELQLPEAPLGQALAFDQVNISYERAECDVTQFPSVASAEQCGELDGWYYDDPDAPQRIQLCPRSCDRVSGPGGNLYYSIGCDTLIR